METHSKPTKNISSPPIGRDDTVCQGYFHFLCCTLYDVLNVLEVVSRVKRNFMH